MKVLYDTDHIFTTTFPFYFPINNKKASYEAFLFSGTLLKVMVSSSLLTLCNDELP